MFHRLFFDLQYRFSKPRWDSGITPPEVVAAIESSKIAPGSALDLGCGTGTNSIYLAQHGFTVVGIDFSPKAIATAREKARRAGTVVDWHVADVTRLDFLHEPFDFVLDLGCYHTLEAAQRTRYAETLARLTHPGSLFMLYAFNPHSPDESRRLVKIRNVGAAPEQIQQAFTRDFMLEHIEHGMDRGDRVSAWYWFRRQ